MIEATYIVTIRNEGEERVLDRAAVKAALVTAAIDNLAPEHVAALTVEIHAAP